MEASIGMPLIRFILEWLANTHLPVGTANRHFFIRLEQFEIMNDKNAPLEEPQKPDYRVLAAIFDEYALVIYQYVVRFCHDPMEAERIFGDVFVQLLEKIAIRKRPPSDPRIPLYRIAYDNLSFG